MAVSGACKAPVPSMGPVLKEQLPECGFREQPELCVPVKTHFKVQSLPGVT